MWCPALEAIKKEGEAGRRKITQYTRYGTLGLAMFQSLGIALALEGSAGLGACSWFRFPHDHGDQPGGWHDVPDVAG
jgi:preprotein translocase subunit SecY